MAPWPDTWSLVLHVFRCGLLVASSLFLANSASGETATAARDSAFVVPRFVWNVSALSPHVASRIHTSASRVPPFPRESPRLRDARNWSEVIVIDGHQCSLRMSGDEGDVSYKARTFGDVRPGDGYSAWYERPPWAGWESMCGPSYHWGADGRIYERSWRPPSDHRAISTTYQYYRSGELLAFDRRDDRIHPSANDDEGPYEWYSELFARDGRLIACGYSKTNGAGVVVSACYIFGKEVGYREFEVRKGKLLIRAANSARR